MDLITGCVELLLVLNRDQGNRGNRVARGHLQAILMWPVLFQLTLGQVSNQTLNEQQMLKILVLQNPRLVLNSIKVQKVATEALELSHRLIMLLPCL